VSTRNLHEEQAEEALQRSLRRSELKGKPLPRRFRLGPTTLESYLASTGGPLPYMVRLRRIEDEIARHERELAQVRAALQERYPAQRLERVWRRVVAEWDFSVVNDLIERHNRWFPIEARLPMDPATGDYALVRGRPYTLRRLDTGWIRLRIA
jgi:hypothetical protein